MAGRPPPNPIEARGRTPINFNRPWISACGKLFYKSQLALSSLIMTAVMVNYWDMF